MKLTSEKMPNQEIFPRDKYSSTHPNRILSAVQSWFDFAEPKIHEDFSSFIGQSMSGKQPESVCGKVELTQFSHLSAGIDDPREFR